VEAPAGKLDEKWDEHGYRWKRCPICDAWVNVGKTKTKDGALNQHQGGKPCQANVHERDAAAAQAALLKIFPPIALPPPPSQQAAPSIWNMHTSLADLQAFASWSYSLAEPPSFSSSHSYTGIRSLESPLPRRVIITNSAHMSTTHQWLGSNSNETALAFMAPVFNNAFSPSFLSNPLQVLNALPLWLLQLHLLGAHSWMSPKMNPALELPWTGLSGTYIRPTPCNYTRLHLRPLIITFHALTQNVLPAESPLILVPSNITSATEWHVSLASG
jgi:hypothetical protein